MALEDVVFGFAKFRAHIWPAVHQTVFSDVPRRYWTMDGLPAKAGEFSPFFADNGTEQVWSREADLKRFMAQMESNIDTHTILTGPSGSGKSTFLRRVVKPVLGDDLIFNSSYLDFTKTFINIIPAPAHLVPRKLELEQAIAAFLEKPIKLSINKVLQDNTVFAIPKELVEIGDTAEAFIRDALRRRPRTYFVFDQIERFLSDLKHLQYQPEEAARTLSVYIVIRVFKTLRQLKNTRTIFAIRADFLFASIDFLTYSLDKLEDADDIFRYFYFDGINASSSPNAVEQQIRPQYERINSPASWEEFVKFTALTSKSVSNTFLTQLSGYMLENFGATDSRVAEIISTDGSTPDDFLEIFFEHLIAGFHQTQRRMVSHDIFKAVVLTIAVENRTSGDAITNERISRLSHIPRRYVDPVVQYLLSRNVVKPESFEGKKYIRFSHDLLFDHVVDSPEFQGRDDLHKGMERLAEQRIPTDKLIDVRTYGDFLNELRHFKIPAIAMLIYWLFAGALTISSTMQVLPLSDELKKWLPWSQTSCEALYGAYNRVIDLLPGSIKSLFAVTECASIGYYSAAIAIMHIAWLWYIYKLTQGYFQYVFARKDEPGAVGQQDNRQQRSPKQATRPQLRQEPMLNRMAMLLVPLGTTFGILVGFAPNLSIIPLTVVGLWMSLLLVIVAHRVGPTTPFGKMNRSWALRTTINMVMTALLLVSVNSLMVSTLPAFVEARREMEPYLFGGNPTIITFWLTSVFLCWFLTHIAPEQQSAISMASRLTQFDVTRNR